MGSVTIDWTAPPLRPSEMFSQLLLAPLPPLFFVVLVVFVVTYLGIVQVLKRRLYAGSDA